MALRDSHRSSYDHTRSCAENLILLGQVCEYITPCHILLSLLYMKSVLKYTSSCISRF